MPVIGKVNFIVALGRHPVETVKKPCNAGFTGTEWVIDPVLSNSYTIRVNRKEEDYVWER